MSWTVRGLGDVGPQDWVSHLSLWSEGSHFLKSHVCVGIVPVSCLLPGHEYLRIHRRVPPQTFRRDETLTRYNRGVLENYGYFSSLARGRVG